MNFMKALGYALALQNIELNINEIPFNVFLKNTGDVLTLCFLEYETSDCLILVETTSEGREELRVVPKDNVEYLSVFYDFSILDDDEDNDKMII